MKISALLFLSIAFLVASCNEKQTTNNSREFVPDHDKNPQLTTAEKIAYKNGLLKWDKVEQLQFTFNVDRGDQHFERTFIWNPKTSQVISIVENDTVKYTRNSQLDSLQTKRDQAFINDTYWLLAPYKLVWDEGTEISEKENVLAPISQDTLNKITVTYTGNEGYTPGDAYDFFYENDYIIKEWIYRQGNSPEPTMMTTFEEYKNVEGMNLATMHKNSASDFKLYFTNISVKKNAE